jgi:phosphomannomutase
MTSTNKGIFREYDIRGVVGKTLHLKDAYLIGKTFANIVAERTEMPNPVIAIGRDGRLSSPDMHKAVCEGLQDAGAQVLDIGLGPTPMLYYAAYKNHTQGGIMVTGSHNPPDHNGFKMVLDNKPFFGADIQYLYSRLSQAASQPGGALRTLDILEEYTENLAKAYDGTRTLNIAWDAGNGATGQVMSMLCARLPGKHVLLNEKIDGMFPAHHPDPTEPKNLVQIIDVVKSQKLDFGIAFDGDGDRIGVVDSEGNILWGDQLLMLYAADILPSMPGATIIADVKASGALFEEISRLGGVPLMWKTGHSLVKSKMRETGSPLAGEMSGHIFFADRYYGFDDALYAAVRLLSLVSRSPKTLAQLRAALPARINTPEIRFACDDERKFAVVEEVKRRLVQNNADFSDVDGVRVNTSEGWWLLRASNTQPVLVARCEAKFASGLEQLKHDLQAQLRLSNVDFDPAH